MTTVTPRGPRKAPILATIPAASVPTPHAPAAPGASHNTVADAAPGPAAAPPAGSNLADRMAFELQPVLAALALLTNCVRVLSSLQDQAVFRPDLDKWLSEACPTWCDPLCKGGDESAESVVCELARHAASIGADMADAAMNGSAA